MGAKVQQQQQWIYAMHSKCCSSEIRNNHLSLSIKSESAEEQNAQKWLYPMHSKCWSSENCNNLHSFIYRGVSSQCHTDGSENAKQIARFWTFFTQPNQIWSPNFVLMTLFYLLCHMMVSQNFITHNNHLEERWERLEAGFLWRNYQTFLHFAFIVTIKLCLRSK